MIQVNVGNNSCEIIDEGKKIIIDPNGIVLKDTIRIILFLQCNLSCSYCCNEQEQFNSQFQKMEFDEIDFSLYKNVCLTGGEPFLNKDLLYKTLDRIPADKNIFIYTNGTRIYNEDIVKLKKYDNLKCLNIGLHHINQLDLIYPAVQQFLNVRYMVQDINKDKFLNKYPHRLREDNIKTWKLNECNMPNEDWILL